MLKNLIHVKVVGRPHDHPAWELWWQKMHTIPPHVEQATRDWEPDLGGCCNPRPNLPSFLVAGHDRVGNPWREGQREQRRSNRVVPVGCFHERCEHLTMHGFKPIQEWTRSGMLTLVLTCHGRPCRVWTVSRRSEGRVWFR